MKRTITQFWHIHITPYIYDVFQNIGYFVCDWIEAVEFIHASLVRLISVCVEVSFF